MFTMNIDFPIEPCSQCVRKTNKWKIPHAEITFFESSWCNHEHDQHAHIHSQLSDFSKRWSVIEKEHSRNAHAVRGRVHHKPKPSISHLPNIRHPLPLIVTFPTFHVPIQVRSNFNSHKSHSPREHCDSPTSASFISKQINNYYVYARWQRKRQQ
jgi:hypothetical protein